MQDIFQLLNYDMREYRQKTIYLKKSAELLFNIYSPISQWMLESFLIDEDIWSDRDVVRRVYQVYSSSSGLEPL